MTPDEELDFLRTKIAALEIKLLETDNTDIAFVFSLPPILEKIFRMLLQQPRVTSEMISERVNAATEPKTAVFRLRKYLQRYDVDIKSKRYLGYWIEPADKKRLLEAIRVTPQGSH